MLGIGLSIVKFNKIKIFSFNCMIALILKIELTNRPMPLKGQLDQIQFDPLSLDLKAKPCRVHQQRMDK